MIFVQILQMGYNDVISDDIWGYIADDDNDDDISDTYGNASNDDVIILIIMWNLWLRYYESNGNYDNVNDSKDSNDNDDAKSYNNHYCNINECTIHSAYIQ